MRRIRSSIVENCFDVLRSALLGGAVHGRIHCRGIIRINSMQQAKINGFSKKLENRMPAVSLAFHYLLHGCLDKQNRTC